MQMPVTTYQVRWRWRPALLTILLVVVFVKLGLWQWHKAHVRQAMQDALNAHTQHVLVVDGALMKTPDVAQTLHGKRVALQGQYLPQYTLLLDNQVENGQAGFHVLTPMLLTDTHSVVWVNRGWIAGFTNHQQLPEIQTSKMTQTITGLAWHIKKTAFQLGSPATDWQPVQQVIDFSRLRKHVPYAMPTLIIKLDASVANDGYVRHWQLPAGEIEKNLGYAYQWFGFAIAAVMIFGYQMLEKKTVDVGE